MKKATISLSLLVKLGSAIVHIEELLDPNRSHPFDQAALNTLISDAEVRALLSDKRYKVFFPVKR